MFKKFVCVVMAFAFLFASTDIYANGPIRNFFNNWRQARVERIQYVNQRYNARYNGSSYGSSGATSYGSSGSTSFGSSGSTQYGSNGGYTTSYGSSGQTFYGWRYNQPAVQQVQTEDGEVLIEGRVKTGPVRRALNVAPRFVPNGCYINENGQRVCPLGANTKSPLCDCEDCQCENCDCGEEVIVLKGMPERMKGDYLVGTAPGMNDGPMLASL